MNHVTDITQLDKMLSYKTIKLLESTDNNNEAYEFNRYRHFEVNNIKYSIEWYVNICYLHHKDMLIPFHNVKLSNTWPRRSKMNLQFYYNNEVCCILKIEDY